MMHILAILGAWFGFANPVYQFPVAALLLPAALIGLAQEAGSKRTAFYSGWLAGTLAYSASLYWIALPVHNYGPLPWIVAGTCPLLLGIYFGLYTGVFALAMNWANNRLSWLLWGLYAGSIWTVLESLRAHLLTGFPWFSLSQAFSPWPQVIQSVQYLGAFGLSGLLVAIVAWLIRFPRSWAALVPALAAICAVLGTGLILWNQPVAGNSSLQVGLIQGNIDQSRKWEKDQQRRIVTKHLELSRAVLRESDPLILIWPETAVPLYLQDSSELRKMITDFCREQEIALLAGAPGYRKVEDSIRLYNKAYLINAKGEIADSYAKRHLVPFGEYVPLQGLFPFLNKLVPGVGDFYPGNNPGPLRLKELALGPLICYEAIFPGLVQERVQKGANLLVNISNDAWFGRSSGPAQHLNQAVLRAVEQKRYLVRSTNTGISGIIDPRGEISGSTPLFKDAAFAATIRPLENRTVFSTYHRLIVWGYYVLAGLLLVVNLFSKEQLQYKIKKT